MSDAEHDEDTRKRAFLARVQARIWSHAVPVRISEIVDDREASWNTGTGILVEVGAHLFVITAWHVVQKFVEIRERGGQPALVISNYGSIEPRFTYRDTAADLVVLSLEAGARAGLEAVPYKPLRGWPPSHVSDGDFVFVCGFPKGLRKDTEEIEHGDFSFFGSVSSATDRLFTIEVDPASVIDAGRHPIGELLLDLGGMSGSPVFVIGPNYMELVGIFSETVQSAPIWMIRPLSGLPSDLGALGSDAV